MDDIAAVATLPANTHENARDQDAVETQLAAGSHTMPQDPTPCL